MIDRKLAKIREGKEMLELLNDLGNESTSICDQVTKDKLAKIWEQFKQLAMQIEQITWALNSNKEHLRYVARIHVIPEVYKRSDDEVIPLRELFTKIVNDCEEVLEICRSLRIAYEMQIRALYSSVNVIRKVSTDGGKPMAATDSGKPLAPELETVA